MPFLTDIDIDERVNHPDNLINRLTVHEITRGNNGSPRVPIEIKKVVAILSNEGEGQTALAKSFGIAQQSVSAYENGKTSIDNIPELKEVVRKVRTQNELNRESAESTAVKVLLTSLNLLPAALNKTTKAKTISGVAKDMAAISNMMSNSKDPDGKGERTMHLHLYAPKMKSVDDYEVIDINVE